MSDRPQQRQTGPPPSGEARQRLLDATIDHLAERGVGDLSLRELAAALGTSHRMVIYHFGSKEGLLVAAIQAMEARQRQALAGTLGATQGSLVETARQFWRVLRDPALAPRERLFFEVYGQALQGRAYAVPLLDDIVDSWLEPMTELLAGQGIPRTQARPEARLGIAVVRGLLLDLLATGDVDDVDEAFEQYLVGLEHRTTDRSGRGTRGQAGSPRKRSTSSASAASAARSPASRSPKGSSST